MFDNRKLNHRINSINERALRVTYQDYKSAFLQLLDKDNSVILATEIFKAKNDLSPEIMKGVFELKELSLYVEMLKLPITVLGQSNI